MAVVAKFRVTRYETSLFDKPIYEVVEGQRKYVRSEKQEMRTIYMAPVYSEDPNSENKKFWDASPSGEIKLGTVNPAAWKEFELDAEYRLTFEKVAPPPAGGTSA